MEGIEEAKMPGSHLISAAAFVEGGIQESCDDACSICLEPFSDSEPSTVTGCKHEFHLHCILEWCQRSSQCPMCWQSISLKDPTSQELLEAVEQERNFRITPSRNATIFHHPTLGDFELQHLHVDTNESELEERIIQHLAAAAAMGRTRHIARRGVQRNGSPDQRHPQVFILSAPNNVPVPSSSPSQGEGESASQVVIVTPSSSPAVGTGSAPLISQRLSSGSPLGSASTFGSSTLDANEHGNHATNSGSSTQSSPNSQNRSGPSDFQSFSESIKSRFNAVSTRYKDSISKSARGLKERIFSRNSSTVDIGSDVRREVDVGLATVSLMMDSRETRDMNGRTENTSASNSDILEGVGNTNAQAPCAATSGLH